MIETPRVIICDKAFRRVGEIGDPKYVTATQRANKKDSIAIGVALSHRQLANIVADGARCLLLDEDDQEITSGWINDINGSGPTLAGQVEFTVEGNFAALEDILGWVVPSSPINGQGSAGQDWTMTGPAETVLKAAVTENATRLGYPITCAPDLGRGSTVSARLRFHPLYERLFPVVDGAGIEAAGIIVTIKQQDGVGLVLDVHVPRQHPRDLTEAGGSIVEWGWSRTTISATRTVVGGQGEAQARVFRQLVAADGRETTYGRKIERFRDARDTDDVTVLYQRGQEVIDDGRAKAGLKLKLAETSNLRVGKQIAVGDRVTIAVAPGIAPITDVLSEVTWSWTADDGRVVTPSVGEKQDQAGTIENAIAVLARRQADQQRR